MARERTDVPNPVYDIFGISLASPEPCIKTKDFDPFRMNTCEKSPRVEVDAWKFDAPQ